MENNYHVLKINSFFFWADGFKKLQDVEGDEFVNENFIRGFPELRKNIIKKKVQSALVMQSLLLIIALMTTSLNNHSWERIAYGWCKNSHFKISSWQIQGFNKSWIK